MYEKCVFCKCVLSAYSKSVCSGLNKKLYLNPFAGILERGRHVQLLNVSQLFYGTPLGTVFIACGLL